MGPAHEILKDHKIALVYQPSNQNTSAASATLRKNQNGERDPHLPANLLQSRKNLRALG